MLSVSLLATACGRLTDLDARLNSIVQSYRFSIMRWELSQIWKVKSPTDSAELRTGNADGIDLVLEYFSLTDNMKALQAEINALAAQNDRKGLMERQEELRRLQQRKSNLKERVESVIGQQIRAILNQEGIFSPADRYIHLGFHFPPINFRLEQPPHVLVISPRDRIESIREIMLGQELPLEAVEDIESKADALGVSSLVTELGGFGATYPTFVADDASLQFTVKVAAEEWLHQYLAFTPLGFMYLLDATGISRNYDVATMNETLAGMASVEISDMVMATFYPQYRPPQMEEQGSEASFDFNRAMREIRIAVDQFLANGEIERAEKFMEERRQYLASQGYYLRKLNQAYFAFYGTYANEPTSVSPIGVEMKDLRSRSASLREFLNTMAGMTSHQDLIDSLKARSSDEKPLSLSPPSSGAAAKCLLGRRQSGLTSPAF